jgi:hypothetical protein
MNQFNEQDLDALKQRLARVQNGEVWGSDHPGPYTPEELTREIDRIKALIAVLEAQQTTTSFLNGGNNTLDEANRIAVQTAIDRRNRVIDTNQTFGATQLPQGAPPTQNIAAQHYFDAPGLTAGEAARAATFDIKLSEQPTDIRDATRRLAAAVRDQIEDLKQRPPYGVNDLKKFDEFVHFLENLAAGLNELANALDRLIEANAKGQNEPFFTEEARKIAQRLGAYVTEFAKAHPIIADYSIKIGLAIAGYNFMRACGLDNEAAGVVAILAQSASKKNKQE